MEEPISEILKFLWDLTFVGKERRDIYIYPQTLAKDGYYSGLTSYYPATDESLDDHWYSKSAIVLKSGETDSLRAMYIIANLLIENNLLIIRTAGMALDEHLIAVDAKGVVDPYMVKGSPSMSRVYRRPPIDGMKWSDFNEWAKLRKSWNNIVSKSVSKLSIYRFQNPDNFYEVCRLVSYIRDHKINKNLNADM